MHLLSTHPDVAVTIAFVLGQMSVLVPMLLIRSVPRSTWREAERSEPSVPDKFSSAA